MSKLFCLMSVSVISLLASAQKSSLDSTQQMKAVEVVSKQATRMETSAHNIEIINSGALVKDACCNLSESFVNSASVDVNYSDAVSGAKEIRLLGLDGAYSQIMIENIPAIRGLGSAFGLNYIPGPWMNSIQVNKGAGSVVNGFESVTGQINIEMKKPQNAEKFYANVFLNQDLRAEANIYSARKLKNNKWSTMLLTHGQYNWLKMDLNHDRFLDNPLVGEGNIMNRWTYQSGKGFTFISAIDVIGEDRRGGQTQFDFGKDKMLQPYWGMQLRTIHTDAFAKTGFTLSETSSIGVQYKYYYHDQSGFIDRRDYHGREHFGYLNFIYQRTYTDNPDNVIKVGASLQTGQTTESFDTFSYRRLEITPGAFVEVTYDYNHKLTLIGGLRADYHNLYGPFLSPRFNLKWNILYYLTLRVSAGRGYHVPVVFAENYGLLSNNRDISIQKNILPEHAWNYGASLTYKFFLDFREGAISVDFYRTDFENQLIVDMEDPRQLRFYNLSGRSYSNSVQTEVHYEVAKGFDVKLAYKYDDVRSTYGGVRKQTPLHPRHKGLASLEYVTKNKQWRFNTSFTWYGKARVPDTSPNDLANQRPLVSKDYFLMNAQITYTLRKKWDFYIGAENILNQTQSNAIIANDAPFSKQFDASLVWGQLRGAMVFAGFRVSIK
jgi:outer membrane receptor for ferrienterochelin and colicins